MPIGGFRAPEEKNKKMEFPRRDPKTGKYPVDGDRQQSDDQERLMAECARATDDLWRVVCGLVRRLHNEGVIRRRIRNRVQRALQGSLGWSNEDAAHIVDEIVNTAEARMGIKLIVRPNGRPKGKGKNGN